MEDIKIEVKTDRVSAKTGNLFIEFESNNIPSGISVIESNFYVYYIINNNGHTGTLWTVVSLRRGQCLRLTFRTVALLGERT